MNFLIYVISTGIGALLGSVIGGLLYDEYRRRRTERVIREAEGQMARLEAERDAVLRLAPKMYAEEFERDQLEKLRREAK